MRQVQVFDSNPYGPCTVVGSNAPGIEHGHCNGSTVIVPPGVELSNHNSMSNGMLPHVVGNEKFSQPTG